MVGEGRECAGRGTSQKGWRARHWRARLLAGLGRANVELFEPDLWKTALTVPAGQKWFDAACLLPLVTQCTGGSAQDAVDNEMNFTHLMNALKYGAMPWGHK